MTVATLLADRSFQPELALLALELARLSGVVAVAPIPWSNTPQRVKAGLIIFLLAVSHGTGDSPVTDMPSAGWAAMHVSTELLVGLCIGMIVRLSVAAAEVAGSALSIPMGFSAAQAFDPTLGSVDSVLTRLFRNVTLLLALIAGLHHAMLHTLLSSFHLLPVGTAAQLESSFPLMLELTTHIIAVGVRLALPVLSLLLMANLALAFVARAAPTMQIFNVGFAVLFAVGAVGLLLSLPEVAREITREFGRNARYFERLLVDLAPR